MRKYWIKLWTEEWLDGSVRTFLSPEERALFIDLLCLAGRSREPGVIYAEPAKGHPFDWLAARLNVSPDFFKKALKKFESQERIKLNEAGKIYIVNWEKYQVETPRQRKSENRRVRERYEEA